MVFITFAIPNAVLHTVPSTPTICVIRDYVLTVMCMVFLLLYSYYVKPIKLILYDIKNVSTMARSQRRLTKTRYQIVFILVVLFTSNGTLTAIVLSMPLPMILYRESDYTIVLCGYQHFHGHINLMVRTADISLICLRLAYKNRNNK